MSKPVLEVTLVLLMAAAFFLHAAPAVGDEVGDLTMAAQWKLNGVTWLAMCHFSGDDDDSDHLRSSAIVLCKPDLEIKPRLICGAKRVQVTFDGKTRVTAKRGVIVIEHAVGSYELIDGVVEYDFGDPDEEQKITSQLEKLLRQNGE